MTGGSDTLPDTDRPGPKNFLQQRRSLRLTWNQGNDQRQTEFNSEVRTAAHIWSKSPVATILLPDQEAQDEAVKEITDESEHFQELGRPVSDEIEFARDRSFTIQEDLAVLVVECATKMDAFQINEQMCPLTEERGGCRASLNQLSLARKGLLDYCEELGQKIQTKIPAQQDLKEIWQAMDRFRECMLTVRRAQKDRAMEGR